MGTARFAYNWAWDQWQQQYAAWPSNPAWPKPSDAAQRRQLHAIKADPCPWMLDVTKNAVQRAIIHWGPAVQNFLAGIAEHPTFKKKGRHGSFVLTNDQFTCQRPQGAHPEAEVGAPARSGALCRKRVVRHQLSDR